MAYRSFGSLEDLLLHCMRARYVWYQGPLDNKPHRAYIKQVHYVADDPHKNKIVAHCGGQRFTWNVVEHWERFKWWSHDTNDSTDM